MSHDVFLSYSSRNKTVADAVCAGLEAEKIRCWIAPRDVLPGSNYGESIVDALEGCRVVVLIYSAASNVSPAVLREAERAMNRGKPIIPFRLEDVPMAKGMEFFLASCHWLDAMSPDMEQHIAKLAGAVRGLMAGSAWTGEGKPSGRDALAAAAAQGRRRRQLFALAGAGGAAAIALAAFFMFRPPPSSTTQSRVSTPPVVAPAPAPADTGTVSLDIGVLSPGESPIKDYFQGTPPAVIRYTLERAGDGTLRISAVSDYLDTLRAGAPVRPLRARYGGASHFVVATDVLLDLKMVNNTAKTIFLTEAVLEVEHSTVDISPLLVLDADPGLARALRVVNEGWSTLESATLRCHLARVGTVAFFDNYPITRELGALERKLDVPLESVIAAVRELDGQPKAACFGEIHYRWLDADGKRAEGSLRFQTEVPLVAAPATNPASGRRSSAATRTTATNSPPATPAAAAALRESGDNYEVRSELSQYLKAGEPDRFQIALSAPRTSSHRFRLKLIYGENGVIRSDPIQLDYFRPRADSGSGVASVR